MCAQAKRNRGALLKKLCRFQDSYTRYDPYRDFPQKFPERVRLQTIKGPILRCFMKVHRAIEVSSWNSIAPALFLMTNRRTAVILRLRTGLRALGALRSLRSAVAGKFGFRGPSRARR